MAIIQRYTTNDNGAIVITGNTLGLSGRRGTNQPGTNNAINQFITTNTNLTPPSPWTSVVNLNNGENITYSWQENSSSAFLTMPQGSEVLYAELIWGGMSESISAGGPNLSVADSINNPVLFVTPVTTTTVTPDAATAQEVEVTDLGTFYTRSQNVTDLIRAGGSGKYTVGRVPSAVNINERSTLNHAGWTLIVVYRNANLLPRNMTVYVGEELINSDSTTDVTVAGFLTPPTGDINARVLVSAQEGDADLRGDRMLFGPNANNLTALSGPNNPANNFFASQINIGDPNNVDVGRIDTSGTFGSRNANADTGILTTAGRQGWDITNVDGSATLTNSQNSALVRMNSDGDVYVLNGLGVQIDTIRITGNKVVDRAEATTGDTIHYTVTLRNEGGVAQSGITFTDPIPAGTTLVTGSLQVSTSYTGNLTDGIVLNSIGSKQAVTIQWDVRVGQDVPNPNPISNTGTISIPRMNPVNTNTVTTYVRNADLWITKQTLPTAGTVAVPGQELSYSITATNLGPDTADGVVITDVVPTYLLNPTYSTTGAQGEFKLWTGSLGLESLANGVSQNIIIKGIVSQTASEVNTFDNTATVTSRTPDPVKTNNTVTITTNVRPSADMSIVKTATANPVTAGTQLVYQLVVNNAGPSNAVGVTVSDTVPLESAQYSLDNGVTWTAWPASNSISLGNFVPSQNAIILVRGNVPSNTTTAFDNTATVTSQTPDPNQTNNTSTVTSDVRVIADVGVTKTSQLNGTTLTYTVNVFNAGPSNATGIVLTDTPPAVGLTNTEYSINNGTSWIAWTDQFRYDIAELENGKNSTILFRGEADLSQTIVNTANVTSVTTDPNLSNNTATVTSEAQLATLSVDKTAAPEPVNAGEQLTYTITIRNTSANNVTAYGIRVTDMIPISLENPKYVIGTGTNYIPWTGTLDISSIPPNGSVQLTIRGDVSLDTTVTNIVNTVTVTATNVKDPVEDTVTTTVRQKADAYVEKKGVPEPIVAGQSILYEVRVGNYGPSVAENVVLSDPPVSLQNPSYSLDAGVTWKTWEEPYQLNLGTIVPDDTRIILFRGTINPAAVGTVSNVARVTTTTTDTNPDNNTSTFVSNITTLADLSVEKEISSTPIVAGDVVTYQITMRNLGPSNALNVRLTDAIPSDILEPQYAETLDGAYTDWEGSLELGTMTAGEVRTIYIRGTADSSLVSDVTNTASIVSTVTTDPNLNNNQSSVTTPTRAVADVSIEKSVIVEEVVAGERLIYRLLVRNLGPSDAVGVDVADVLPSNVTNQMYSIDGGTTWLSWTGTITLGDLAAGDTQAVLISGDLASFTTEDILNVSVVSAETFDPNLDNNIDDVTTKVITRADLAVYKVSAPKPSVQNNILTYTVAVANHGPSDAANFILEDVVPAALSNVEYSLDDGVTWEPWTGSVSYVTAPNGFLRSILIRGIVNSQPGATIINTANVSSDTTDPRLENNTSTDINLVDVGADVAVVKTANVANAQVGDTIVYTVEITNNGPNVAQGVTLRDAQPANLAALEVSYNNGTSWETWTGSYDIGRLADGATESILLRGTVASVATGTSAISNTAQVTSTTTDPDLSNNISTTIVSVGTSGSEAILFITKNVLTFPICMNQWITYAINAWNIGTVDAVDVQLIDNPLGLRNVQFSLDGGRTWAPWKGTMYLGRFAAGEGISILLRGIVMNTQSGILSNTAFLTTSSAVSSCSVMSATVTSRVQG